MTVFLFVKMYDTKSAILYRQALPEGKSMISLDIFAIFASIFSGQLSYQERKLNNIAIMYTSDIA